MKDQVALVCVEDNHPVIILVARLTSTRHENWNTAHSAQYRNLTIKRHNGMSGVSGGELTNLDATKLETFGSFVSRMRPKRIMR